MTSNPIRLRTERRISAGFVTGVGAPGREQVRSEFFRERFGVGPGQTIEERRHGGLVLGIGGHPAGWLREYRAAHRALPPAPKRLRSMPEILARIDELEAGATELWP
jgi:hypothetical protein